MCLDALTADRRTKWGERTALVPSRRLPERFPTVAPPFWQRFARMEQPKCAKILSKYVDHKVARVNRRALAFSNEPMFNDII